MSAPLRLRVGDVMTRQQSPVTCGAAAATVARMLVDGPFERWVRAGEGHPVLGAEGGTPEERFTSYERTVHRRMTGLRRAGGRIDLPWPRRLGTPPWGLRSELETYGSVPGTRYTYELLRTRDAASLRRSFAHLDEVVVEGEPAALYVGDDRLPRHVVLVLPGRRGELLAAYEPAVGRVVELGADEFASCGLTLGGWRRPWLLVRPTGHRRVLAASRQTMTLPRLAPETSVEPLTRHPG